MIMTRSNGKLVCAIAGIGLFVVISYKSIGHLKGEEYATLPSKSSGTAFAEFKNRTNKKSIGFIAQPQQPVAPYLGKQDDLAGLEMDDPRLISFIRQNYLVLPSKDVYNLTGPSQNGHYSQYGQSEYISSQIFTNKSRAGTFFEAGAFDGETFSNSLFFEKTLNWTGILVEPMPSNVRSIGTKHRKANFFPCCLSGNRSFQAPFECFDVWNAMCHVTDGTRSGLAKGKGKALVWCFPLYSILLAADLTSIDYMSLDVEFFELKVLAGVPFHKLRVKVIQIEFSVLGEDGGLSQALSAKRLADLREFFKANWPMYREYAVMRIDVVFVNTALLDFPLPQRLTWN